MVNRARRVTAQILSPRSFFDLAEFTEMVHLHCELLPSIRPERWDIVEPLKYDFRPEDLPKIQGHEGRCFTVRWKREHEPQAEGGFGTMWRSAVGAVGSNHGGPAFSVDASRMTQEELVDYIEHAAPALGADFAYIEAQGPDYREYARQSESAIYGGFNVTTHVLRHWLPDIFWLTVFGPPYVRLFGRERLLSVPAYRVEELDSHRILVQLTERVFDAFDDFPKLDAIRKRARDHLACNAFFDPARAYDRRAAGRDGTVFNVPTFELETPQIASATTTLGAQSQTDQQRLIASSLQVVSNVLSVEKTFSPFAFVVTSDGSQEIVATNIGEPSPMAIAASLVQILQSKARTGKLRATAIAYARTLKSGEPALSIDIESEGNSPMRFTVPYRLTRTAEKCEVQFGELRSSPMPPLVFAENTRRRDCF